MTQIGSNNEEMYYFMYWEVFEQVCFMDTCVRGAVITQGVRPLHFRILPSTTQVSL